MPARRTEGEEFALVAGGREVALADEQKIVLTQPAELPFVSHLEIGHDETMHELLSRRERERETAVDYPFLICLLFSL